MGPLERRSWASEWKQPYLGTRPPGPEQRGGLLSARVKPHVLHGREPTGCLLIGISIQNERGAVKIIKNNNVEWKTNGAAPQNAELGEEGERRE